MNWHIAKLVFQVINSEGVTPQFDEQWRLVKADEVTWAYEKARVIGWLEQGCFNSVFQKKGEWKFIEVVELQQLSNMEDGAPIFSTTEEPLDAFVYVDMIRRKAQQSRALARNEELDLQDSA
jgi:hypothetical protein